MKPSDRPARCALFDFDGTLTKRSTVGPFIAKAAGLPALAKAAAPLAPLVARHLLGRGGFEQALARCAQTCLTGLARARLEQAGEEVARRLDGAIWPKALSALEGHLGRGEPVAIVTGGYGFVAQAWARKLGLPLEVFSSELAWDASDRVSSAGLVRVGAAKLEACHWGRAQGLGVVAYGNSRGDWEMLEAADQAFWVDARGAMALWRGR